MNTNIEAREQQINNLRLARRATEAALQALRLARLAEAEEPSLSHRVQVARSQVRLARCDADYARAYVACGGR